MVANTLTPRPRWIVFDAADTLIRADPGVAAAYHDIARRHGVDVSERHIADALPIAFRRHFPSGECNERQEQRGWRAVVAEVCHTIAVGTTVAGGPPHRSVREELHSYGSYLESGAESLAGIGVHDVRFGKMRLGQAFHTRPGPTLLSFLTPFTNYAKPESNNLIDEAIDTLGVARNGIILEPSLNDRP